MTQRTVQVCLDARSADRLEIIGESEGQTPAELVAVAARLIVDMSPAARQALLSFDACKLQEREFVTHALGRAALNAREKRARRLSRDPGTVTASSYKT